MVQQRLVTDFVDLTLASLQESDHSQTSDILSVLPLAIAVMWHCVLEERVSAAVSSIDMLRPSQRLPSEERATLVCRAQVTIIAGHIVVAASAVCGSWVCFSSVCSIVLCFHRYHLVEV